jgi:hypothetical protein
VTFQVGGGRGGCCAQQVQADQVTHREEDDDYGQGGQLVSDLLVRSRLGYWKPHGGRSE